MTDQSVVDAGSRPVEATDTPARPRRSLRGLITHEWIFAAVSSLLVAMAMTWPAIKNLRNFPFDEWDSALQTWQMAWIGWSTTHDIGRLWETNAYLGDQYALAYSDTLLGYLPFTLIGSGSDAAII